MDIDLIPLVQALAALALAGNDRGCTVPGTDAAPLPAHRLPRPRRVSSIGAPGGARRRPSHRRERAKDGEVTSRNAALAKGVQHVIASTPEALTALGVTPQHVRDMVEARFGGLLAADPNVSIGNSPAA
jgi:hypothetical protein